MFLKHQMSTLEWSCDTEHCSNAAENSAIFMYCFIYLLFICMSLLRWFLWVTIIKWLFSSSKKLIFTTVDQKDAAHVTYSVTHGPTPPRSIRLTSRSSPGNSSALERKKKEARNENTLHRQITLKKKIPVFTHLHLSNTHAHKINWAQLS